MATQFIDLEVYGGAGHAGASRDLRGEARFSRWLEILAVLAETEGEFGLVPADMAARVAAACRAIEPDSDFLNEVRQGFEASSHSTQGLIQAVQRRCQGGSGQWLDGGATVQDLADTWMMAALRDARGLRPRSSGDRCGATRIGRAAPRYGHGGTHPRAARTADHVRF